MGETTVSRGPLIGAVIAGVAGAAWAQWAAGGATGGASVAIRVLGIMAGVVVVLGAARLLPASEADGDRSMFRAWYYRLTVVTEVVAIAAGAAVLGTVAHGQFVIVWVALVVGAHFLVFGRFFRPVFHQLGAAVVVAAASGAAVGIAGAGPGAVELVTGLISAASMLVAGGAVVRAAVSDRG
jgi:hypothetical protein